MIRPRRDLLRPFAARGAPAPLAAGPLSRRIDSYGTRND